MEEISRKFEKVPGMPRIREVGNAYSSIRYYGWLIGWFAELFGLAVSLKALDRNGTARVWIVNRRSYEKWKYAAHLPLSSKTTFLPPLGNFKPSQPQQQPFTQQQPTPPVTQPPTLPPQPKLEISEAEKEKYLEKLKSKRQEFDQWIDTLGLPEDNEEWDYSKKGLKLDFQRAEEEAISKISTSFSTRDAEGALSHFIYLKNLLEKHLKQDSPLPSSYVRVGITNYAGNNCFLNASLQSIVHSELLDYPLFRPFPPPPSPDYDAELLAQGAEEPKEEIVPPPNWDALQNDDDRIAASRKYDEEKEAAQMRFNEAKKRKDAHREEGIKRFRYEQKLNEYQEHRALRNKLQEVVLKMRRGEIPSEADTEALGGKGDPGSAANCLSSFSKALQVPLNYCLTTEGLDRAAIDGGWGLNEKWTTLIMGSGTHLWAFVKVEENSVVEINDSSVEKPKTLENAWNRIKELTTEGENPEMVILEKNKRGIRNPD